LALSAIALLSALQSVNSFQAIRPSGAAVQPTTRSTSDVISTSSALFGKKKKGGAARGQQQQQEKQSVKDARFDAATRQFMFTLVGLTKMLPDKSKKILDNIHLSFYPGAKIGIVGLNGSGKVRTSAADGFHRFAVGQTFLKSYFFDSLLF
jgi:ABC-type transport system involved in cytochrome bd biosynthesis fused ATPase/permease subunit